MNEIISILIDDFQQFNLPEVVERSESLPFLTNKVDVITGMRRAGKTWFCYQKIKELEKNNVLRNRILYLNFEDDRLQYNFNISDFSLILEEYYKKFPFNKDCECYFFFDEIHNIEGWDKFIRRILDSEKIKITITGSNSKLLSREISTSLRGRSITTEIFPFSFTEVLHKNNIKLENNKVLGSKNIALIRNLFDSYNTIGGFPEIQNYLENIRIEVLQGYVETVLFRDVVERYQIKNLNPLHYLINHIMNNPGTILSLTSLYKKIKNLHIKCSQDSLYDFARYLEEAYLVYKVPFLSNSMHKKQLNPPKVYVIDNGLLQAMSFKVTSDIGALLENLVFMHLRRKKYIIEYYKNSDGFEVDFVVRKKNGEFIDFIQVCHDISNEKTLFREIRGLEAGINSFNGKSGKIITSNTSLVLSKNIEAVPVWKWIIQN